MRSKSTETMNEILDFINETFFNSREIPSVQEIADHIIYDVRRGVTALKSVGWYSQKESNVLLIILRKNQMNEVINEIHRIDKNAFISVSSAKSVYGEGFEEIKTGLNLKKSDKNQEVQ